MKSQDVKNSRARNGVSRLWLGVAAAAGAAIAYRGDRERGSARRQAAVRQLSGAAQAAADRTSRWRNSGTARLPGQAQSRARLPGTAPTDAGGAATETPRSQRAERAPEAAHDGEQAGLGIRRLTFDARLVDALGHDSHIQFCPQTEARDIRTGDDATTTVVTAAGDFRARFVAVADGLRSAFRHRLGW